MSRAGVVWCGVVWRGQGEVAVRNQEFTKTKANLRSQKEFNEWNPDDLLSYNQRVNNIQVTTKRSNFVTKTIVRRALRVK